MKVIPLSANDIQIIMDNGHILHLHHGIINKMTITVNPKSLLTPSSKEPFTAIVTDAKRKEKTVKLREITIVTGDTVSVKHT